MSVRIVNDYADTQFLRGIILNKNLLLPFVFVNFSKESGRHHAPQVHVILQISLQKQKFSHNCFSLFIRGQGRVFFLSKRGQKTPSGPRMNVRVCELVRFCENIVQHCIVY